MAPRSTADCAIAIGPAGRRRPSRVPAGAPKAPEPTTRRWKRRGHSGGAAASPNPRVPAQAEEERLPPARQERRVSLRVEREGCRFSPLRGGRGALSHPGATVRPGASAQRWGCGLATGSLGGTRQTFPVREAEVALLEPRSDLAHAPHVASGPLVPNRSTATSWLCFRNARFARAKSYTDRVGKQGRLFSGNQAMPGGAKFILVNPPGVAMVSDLCHES